MCVNIETISLRNLTVWSNHDLTIIKYRNNDLTVLWVNIGIITLPNITYIGTMAKNFQGNFNYFIVWRIQFLNQFRCLELLSTIESKYLPFVVTENWIIFHDIELTFCQCVFFSVHSFYVSTFMSHKWKIYIQLNNIKFFKKFILIDIDEF